MTPMSLSLTVSEPGSDVDFIVAKIRDRPLVAAALRVAIRDALVTERSAPTQRVKRMLLERALHALPQ